MSRKIYYKSEVMNAANDAFVGQVLDAQVMDAYTPEQKLAFIEGLLCMLQAIDDAIADEDK